MNDGTAALFLASMLLALAFLALAGAVALSRRLDRARRSLRDTDVRLATDAATLSEGWAGRRASLVEANAATERALWTLARFGERLDTTREALAERRTELDRQRQQIIAAGRTLARIKRGARMLIRAIELRRTFLA